MMTAVDEDSVASRAGASVSEVQVGFQKSGTAIGQEADGEQNLSPHPMRFGFNSSDEPGEQPTTLVRQRSNPPTPMLRPARDRRGTLSSSCLYLFPRSGAARAPTLDEQSDRSVLDDHKAKLVAGKGVGHFLAMTVGATGVVFGDIGTSPLYTMTGVLSELPGETQPRDVCAIFSMIFWTLTWVVCVKYLLVVLRVSHHGEGGTFALMQTIFGSDVGDGSAQISTRTKTVVTVLAMLGCALLVGDGVITPVISVLGALEGLPATMNNDWEVVVAVTILSLIFLVQKSGSQAIGTVAGPTMVVWFGAIAGLGIYNLIKAPEAARQVFFAISPTYVYDFWFVGEHRGYQAWRALAGVVLCVTGAEALYADLGHFGAGPITLAWFSLVYPCLVLQYMGQAAALIASKDAANPFWGAVPEVLRVPMLVLSTVAAVLASQAMLSGLFSLLTQAHALQLLPRIMVVHTNPHEEGQVYIPELNTLLAIICICICIAFRTSASLSGAYGITVTGTFVVTSLLLWIVLRRVWRWSCLASLALLTPMIVVDVLFWTSNMVKIGSSGYVPVVITVIVCTVMFTYHWGRSREEEVLMRQNREQLQHAVEGRSFSIKRVTTVEALCAALREGQLIRTPRTAVFLTPFEWRVPRSLGMLAQSLGCLPRTLLLLSVSFVHVPFVAEEERAEFEAIDEECGVYRVSLRYGYAEPLTAARLALANKLAQIAEARLEDFPALAQLVPRSPSANGGGNGSASSGQARADDGAVTFIVNKLHYATDPSHGIFTRALVGLYSALVLNARKTISFFGLEDQNTLEVSTVRFL